MKQRLLIILLTLLSSAALRAETRLWLTSQRISAKEGLPSNTVYQLAQDPDGFVWMATSNGLCRYDGYTTLNYTSLSCDPRQRMEARVGRLICDEERRLLWLSTATYVNACYDLRQARFVDWTGCGDMMRSINKYVRSSEGLWFYGNNFGVRFSDGRSATDYTRENGSLPSNGVDHILADQQGRIWMATDSGMTCRQTDGRLLTTLRGHRILSTVTAGGTVYCLDDANRVFAYSGTSEPRLLSQRPAGWAPVARVNISFVWQGRWMLFTPEGTLSVALADGAWQQAAGTANIADGLNQGQLEGYHFVANESGRLWIFADDGRLKVLDLLANSRFTSYKGRKFNVAADRRGRLFIATYGNGLFVWNPLTDQLDHFKAEDEQAVVGTNYLLYAMSDRQGNIWIGAEEGGASRLTVVESGLMTHVVPEPSHKGDRANAVNAIAERRDGMLMLGTREGGIYQYDRQSGHVRRLSTLPSLVRCMLVDRNDRLWIGTSDRGLTVGSTTYSRQSSTHRLPSDNVRALCQDRLGRIWIGTWNDGLLMTDAADELSLTFSQFMTSSMNQKRINALALDAQGTLWIGTNNGLYSVDASRNSLSEADFRGYYDSGQLPSGEITALYAAKDGTLWAAAAGGGLIKCRFDADGSVSYSQLARREGLASSTVYSIVGDADGYLWVGTDAGISRINTHNGIINSYQPLPSMQANVSTEGSALLTSDSLLLFGTLYGMQAISPRLLSRHASLNLPPVITDLHINGHSVYEDSTFRQSLTTTSHISLSAQDNTLSIFFSNFAFAAIQSSLYQYYLEGQDRSWNPITTANHADYTELPPGRYTFHLRSLDANNEWMDEVRLTITIHQPWYNTWWAWLCYLILTVLAAWYVYHNWKTRFNLHQQMKMDRQLMDFRSRLFTSITHEFRTPLAIIKGAVDKLDGDKAAVQTARRGATRLLRLVNQFMEYRKASTGNLRLQVERADIVTFLRDICQDFWPMAEQKNIQLTFSSTERHHPMLFDAQMVESVVYNLLSNAVKYVPEGGRITLHTRADNQAFTITVADSGPGISPEQQAVLFQPFMQGKVGQGGMGIGLFTAHAIAEAHHGSLNFEPPSTFFFTLPADDGVYQPDDYAQTPVLAVGEKAENREADAIIREMLPAAINDITVAIIEDDLDMMAQIQQEVGAFFHTLTFTNGLSGYEGVAEGKPALVICDVMLPDMDGYEIVSRLKANAETRDIPVVMLTALANEAHQLKAYKVGADDYMVKPCNFRLLVARCMQLIKWRSMQQPKSPQSAAQQPYPTEASAPTAPLLTSRADKVFLEKLHLFTAQHLGEETFTIDQLAQMMAMGRTKFFGRVKELTGLSPNKFLLQERMKKAADLLADGELTVAEVSYKVGFQDPSYFNKCFKAHFGVVPSKYAASTS